MRHEEAIGLVRDGVDPGGVWADLGAGTGTFTRALGELLGPRGVVHAVDRKTRAVRALRRLELPDGATLHAVHGDFTAALDLPDLDGVLMANSLHFSEDQESTLSRVTDLLRPGGRLLLVEYDRTRGNRWVPHPVPPDRFRSLARRIGLSPPREVGRRRSAHGRDMYAAVARKADRAREGRTDTDTVASHRNPDP